MILSSFVQVNPLSFSTTASTLLLPSLSSTCILYSRKFSSVKNFVKTDRQAVRQEFIFVKHRPWLICSSVTRSLLFCLSFIFTFMNISDHTLAVFFVEKISQEFNLVKKLL